MLQLQIVQGPAGSTQPVDSFMVGPGGATIGRTDACDWKLDDPNSLISRMHFHVTFEANEYRLRDTSTNGTFLNGSDDAIGRGNQVPLKDGDQIQLGEHVISVVLHAQAAAPAPDLGPPPDLGFAPGEPMDSDSGGLDTGIASGQETPDKAAFADVVATPLGADLLGPGESPGKRRQASPDLSPLIGEQQAAASPLDIPVRAKHDGSDLLEPAPASANFIPDEGFDPQELLNPQPPEASRPAQSSAAPAQSAGGMIPDDWFAMDEGDLLAESSGAEAAPEPPGRIPDLPPGAGEAPAAIVPPATPLQEPPLPDLDNLLDDPGGLPAQPANESPPDTANFAEAAPEPKPKPKMPVAAPAVAQPMPSATAGGLRNALRTVLGEEADTISESQLLSVVEQLASIVAIVTPRTMAALHARTQFKETLRLRQTLIRASENNPLKISFAEDQALQRLLLDREPGMLGGVEAVDQALGELAAHQSALIAALKPALRDTLEALSPERIEKKSGRGKADRLPLMNRRGKLWEEYSSLFNSLAEADGRGMEQKFLLALAEYYEDALSSFDD